MFVVAVERFISKLVMTYGSHPVSTDGGTWYPHQACRFLKLKHHLHSSHEKSIIERTNILKIEPKNALMLLSM